MARTSRELATRGRADALKVDPVEEPSAEWGWHQHFPRATLIAGVLGGLIVLAMLIGHPSNGIEIAYVIATALIFIAVAIVSANRRRKRWRP